MTKKFYLLFCLITLISLVACNGQEEAKEPDTGNEVEPPIEEEQVPEETEEGTTSVEETDTEEEPSNSEESDPNEQSVYQNEVFKDVVVSDSTDQFVVTGKAQVFEGVFQYRLIDGDNVLQEDKYQTEGAPAWGDFEISFDKNIVSSNDVVLELFVYSAKDGSKINVLEIPINP